MRTPEHDGRESRRAPRAQGIRQKTEPGPGRSCDDVRVRRFARLGVTAACGILLLGACTQEDDRGASDSAVLVIHASDRVVSTGHLEVARTPGDRERGLAGRPWIPDNGGMLFVLETATDSGFWMRGTVIPLSIAFWDDRGEIVAILDMKPCRAEPCPLYFPGTDYIGAVEMRKGWFEEHGVEVGDVVEVRFD